MKLLVKLMLTAYVFVCAQGFAQVNTNLPVVQNVGVIPVQWSDENRAESEFFGFKKLLEDEYPKAIRAARKYRVTNEDLVASQWRDVNQRKELIRSQEIDGFFSLQVQMKADVVTLILRLMSSNLETYILESTTRNAEDLKTGSRGQIIGMVENLVFKMLNRVPVDAHVTSLQGRYLTLSGGQLSGIQIGDRIDIVRAFILSRHPANGSWMNIKTRSLGNATIVEVKQFTSVAKLDNMIAEDAIRVGDGVKIPRIKPRAKFTDALGKPRNPGRINDPVVVNPMYPGDTKVQPVLPDKSQPATNDKASPAAPVAGSPQQSEGGDQPSDIPSYDAPGADDFDNLVDMLVDYGRGSAGMRLWNYGGSASAKASFPVVLVNHGAIMFGKRMTRDINLEATGNANFGSTTNGGAAFGFGGAGRIFMHKPMDKGRRWKAGAEGQFNSLAVTQSTFGGGDIVTGGGFIGIEGPVLISERLLTYYAEFALFPINLGQMGIAGTKRSIQSSFNSRITLAAEYQLSAEQKNAGELAWGGKIELENYSYSLEGNNKMSGSSFNILGTAAWKF